jgi:putative ABC transport system substrate-binding protein
MQFDQLRRRQFISLLGGAAAWPLAARAQQPAMPVIGFLNGRSPQAYASFLAAFLQGLKQAGYVDGQNALIEYRWAQNQSDRLPGLAAELVRYPLAVMVTSGGDEVVQAARAAAATTPIVSTFGFDPVARGLASSLNRPGGNITGVSVFSTVLVAKRLELLRELVPNVAVVAFLVNPANPSAAADAKDFTAAAEKLAQRVVVLNAPTAQECEAAFADLARQGVGALAMQSDAFFNTVIDHIVALAKRHAVPVMYARREFAAAGGLLSYGSSATEAYRQLGIYTGQVLKGVKPADLPILLPSRFELVINLSTAKALGIDVPLSLMVRADEMID